MSLPVGTLAVSPSLRASRMPEARPRAVVAAGAGFIGSHLCLALLNRGFEVDCLGDFSAGSMENIAQLTASDSFRVIRGDVAERIRELAPAGLVIRCALPANSADHLAAPIDSLRTISAGTLQAIEFAHRHGCRFVLVSSCDVYGPSTESETTFTTVDPCHTVGAYVTARRFSESAAATNRAGFGVDTAVVRVFNTYGPSMRPGGLVARFVRDALAGRPLTVPGSGALNYPLCYVATWWTASSLSHSAACRVWSTSATATDCR